MTDTDKNPLEFISMVDEFVQLNEFMQDESLEEALDVLVKLYVKPNGIPPQKVASLIVQLQAWSAKFQLLAAIYKGLKKGPAGSEEARKKDIYFTCADIFDKLAQSVKYLAKTY